MFTSATQASLPTDDQPEIAGIAVPAGQRIIATHGDDAAPVAWISRSTLPGAELDRLVVAFAEAYPRSGLWPVRASGLDDDITRPWIDGELTGRDERELEALAVLDGTHDGEGFFDEDADDALGVRFVGMADAVPGPDLTPDDLAVGEPGALLLVPTDRPANVIRDIGWLGACNIDLEGEPLSAVLRSWEDRFGATLVGLGFDTLVVQVPRLPGSPEQRRLLLGEHYSFCSDNIDQGLDPQDYLAGLAEWRYWSFWWD